MVCWNAVHSSGMHRSGEIRHPCLVPDLREKAFSFCPLSMMLALGFSYIAFIMLRYTPYTPSYLRFLSWVGIVPYQMIFFHIYWYGHVIFFFLFLKYYVYWFANIISPLYPWDESHLVMVYDLFNVLLDAVCQYFVEDFSVYVHQWYWPEVFFLCCVFIWFWD